VIELGDCASTIVAALKIIVPARYKVTRFFSLITLKKLKNY
jgi:hypothetical protein